MTLAAPKIELDIGPEQSHAMHGRHAKNLVVMHETVSYNVVGLADVRGISHYLGTTRHDGVLYGIHGIVDREGNQAWAKNYGDAIFYHADSSGAAGDGLVNTRGIGIELISDVPLHAAAERSADWTARRFQLWKAAELIEWQCRLRKIPLVYSDSSPGSPGITTHWDVSHRWQVPDGHWDCWPKQKGGYFPVFDLIAMAKAIRDGKKFTP